MILPINSYFIKAYDRRNNRIVYIFCSDWENKRSSMFFDRIDNEPYYKLHCIETLETRYMNEKELNRR
jgi:hypothetical protein